MSRHCPQLLQTNINICLKNTQDTVHFILLTLQDKVQKSATKHSGKQSQRWPFSSFSFLRANLKILFTQPFEM